jgi:hypothetical protein
MQRRADALAKANERILTRQEALDRLRIKTEVHEKLRDLEESSSSIMDLSAEGAMEELGTQGRAIIEEAVSGHSGREESQIRLQELLEGEFLEFKDKGAAGAVKAGDERVQAFAGEVLNSLEARAINGGDIDSLIQEGMAFIEPGTELASAMRPGDEIVFRRNLYRRVASGAIERLFAAGQLGEVQNALFDPTIQRMLGEEDLRNTFKRLERAQGPEDLVEVFDETSPTRSRLIPKSQAVGMPGRERSPMVSISNMSETALATALGKKDADTVFKLEENARTASSTKAEVVRMKAAIESGRFTPGVFSDVRVFMARLADFVGAGEDVKKLVGDAATADTLDAAAARLGVQAAQTLGRITNMSLQFVKDSMPSLVRTPEGNMILLEVMDRAADREIKLATMADEYIQRYNTLRPKETKTYFQAVRDLDEVDPVITEELQQRIIEGSKSKTKSFKETFGEVLGETPTYSTPEEVESLPSGTEYIWGPNNKRYRKN